MPGIAPDPYSDPDAERSEAIQKAAERTFPITSVPEDFCCAPPDGENNMFYGGKSLTPRLLSAILPHNSLIASGDILIEPTITTPRAQTAL